MKSQNILQRVILTHVLCLETEVQGPCFEAEYTALKASMKEPNEASLHGTTEEAAKVDS
jgi:hypothetical protein